MGPKQSSSSGTEGKAGIAKPDSPLKVFKPTDSSNELKGVIFYNSN